MAVRRWRISIVYDSPALPGFEEGWGFSALISSEGSNILFDCGWDGRLLRDNLSRLGLKVSDIDGLVLSHPHWDHVTGLPEILRDPEVKGSLPVVLPAGFSKNLQREIGRRATVREVSRPLEIFPGMWATGPLGGEVPEQALVLRGEREVAILTGCGHPGVAPILAAGSSLGSARWLIGGLHDCTLRELERSLERYPSLTAVLCHCTRCKAEASAAGLDRATTGAAGKTYDIDL